MTKTQHISEEAGIHELKATDRNVRINNYIIYAGLYVSSFIVVSE